MIYFNINLRNPWWDDRFENIMCRGGKTPFEHKFWEFEVLKTENLFRIEFNWTIRTDHAGVNLELGLFGYQASISLHDSRHWHPEKNRWIDYSNKEELKELYGEDYYT